MGTRKILGLLTLILVAITIMALSACSTGQTSTSPAAPPVSQPSTSASQPAPSAPPASPATAKTLKFGVICWFGWPIGVDMMHGLELQAELLNKNGGLTIGGETYKVELVEYDDNNVQTTAVSAANRLIDVDKAKYVIGDGSWVDAFMPITEANKVILSTMSATPPILSPDNHYSFQGGFQNNASTSIGWFIKNHPDYKTYIMSSTDDTMGHAAAEQIGKIFEAFGIKLEIIYFPPTAQDLSSLGTKVKTANPDVFMPMGAGPIQNGLVISAVYKAGYEGQIFAQVTLPAATLTQVAPVESLEGMVCAAWPVEFDPALTQPAKDFKAAWIAKYGKWEGPEIQAVGNFTIITEAIKQAGSLDPDKVASVIGSGLKFDGPNGPSMMIDRPDMGNNRTIDSINTVYMKEIKKGQPVLLATIGLDEATTYFRKAHP
jgi:branched-chain amino acid transport system substrate-binding protein